MRAAKLQHEAEADDEQRGKGNQHGPHVAAQGGKDEGRAEHDHAHSLTDDGCDSQTPQPALKIHTAILPGGRISSPDRDKNMQAAELTQQFGTAAAMVAMLVGALRWMAGRWDKDRERAEDRWSKTTDQLTSILRENTIAQTETASAMRELRQTVGNLPCKTCPVPPR